DISIYTYFANKYGLTEADAHKSMSNIHTLGKISHIYFFENNKNAMLSKRQSRSYKSDWLTEEFEYDELGRTVKQTEILWIFFGIHTANAVRMIPKMNSCKM
ncbi:hypothetical protein D0T57_15620, partial [Dysgonomonas sp. 511]|nr:hypothetical protein [Dysgonomonas sp. 511]